MQLPTELKFNYFDAEGNMQEVTVGSLTKGKKVGAGPRQGGGEGNRFGVEVVYLRAAHSSGRCFCHSAHKSIAGWLVGHMHCRVVWGIVSC